MHQLFQVVLTASTSKELKYFQSSLVPGTVAVPVAQVFCALR